MFIYLYISLFIYIYIYIYIYYYLYIYLYIIYIYIYIYIYIFILKTPCGVTPPPPHFWGLAFRDPFRQVALAGLCLPILWLILFDLGRSWQILADFVRTLFFCRFKKKHLQTSVQKGCPKTTTNPSTIRSKLQKIGPNIDPKSIKSRPKSIKSQSESIREKGRFQDPPKVAPSLDAFLRLLAPLGGFWAPFWAELDPEGGPQIVFLGHHVGKMTEKRVSTNETSKNHSILIEIWSQNEKDLGGERRAFRLIRVAKSTFSGSREIYRKVGAKRGPKNYQNLCQKSSVIRFLRF